MNAKLYELISVVIRQAALIYGTWLIATGHLDQGLLQPLIGLALNSFSIIWMTYARFIDPAVTVDPVVVEAVTPTANT